LNASATADGDVALEHILPKTIAASIPTMDNPKVALIESEIENCRQTRNWVGLGERVSKYHRKYYPNGSGTIALS
jgi:hypothetical protein